MKCQLKMLMIASCGMLLSGISHAEDEWKPDSCLPDVLWHGVGFDNPFVEWDAGIVDIRETQEESYLVGPRINGPTMAAFVCFRNTSLPTQVWVGASTVGHDEVTPRIYSSTGWLQKFFAIKEEFGDDIVAYTANFQSTIWSEHDGEIRYSANAHVITPEGAREEEKPWTSIFKGGGSAFLPRFYGKNTVSEISFQPSILIEYPIGTRYSILVNQNIRMGKVNNRPPSSRRIKFNAMQFFVHHVNPDPDSKRQDAIRGWDASEYQRGLVSTPTIEFVR